jgi:hypothetical protein
MSMQSTIAIALLLGFAQAFAHGQTFQGSWTEVGPGTYTGFPTLGSPEPLSGQVSAIAVDLNRDPTGNTVYVGSSSGGLWKSTNGLCANLPNPSKRCTRPTFVLLSDQSQSLSVGAIALDPRSNPVTIYVGSGAPDNSSNISSYTGEGILISRDGGKSWASVGSADNGAHPFAGLGFSSILVDPQNTDILLAATGIGTDPNHPVYSVPQGDPGFQNLGIYRSIDAGKSWHRVMAANYGTQPSNCYPTPISTSPEGFFHIDLVYEPTEGTYYAGITGVGIYASTDQGSLWKPLSALGLGKGLPAANEMGRISLATRNGVLWAFVMLDPCATPPAPVFGLYQSTTHANTWTQIVDPEPPPPQPPPATPPPANQDTVAKGALMYVAAPPGAHSLLIGTQLMYFKQRVDNPAFPWTWIENNLHGDQHAIAFVNARTWYAGDDGGAWVTTNRGASWTSLNTDLRTLEFFSADADSGGSASYAGGMQDNGPGFISSAPAWAQLVSGDGTYVKADPQNANAFFTSINFGNLFYVSASKQTPPLVTLTSPALLAPFEVLPPDSHLLQGLIGQARTLVEHGSVLLAGTIDPWLIGYDPLWPSNPCQGPQPPKTKSNPDLTCNPQVVQLTKLPSASPAINYIASVPGDPTTAYLSAGSVLYFLQDISFAKKNVKLTQIKGGPVNGTDLLGHLAVSFTQPRTLYLIKIGFLEGQKIFKTTNAGQSWINISGNLPNIPLNWITLDPLNPDFLYLATNAGVFVATDGGVVNEKWHSLGTGLPHVPVTQLTIVPGPNLMAATYGRNVWMLAEAYTSVGISIETGNDDARDNTELWVTITGERPFCLKPSNNANPDGVCNNNNGGSAPDWNNWTTSSQEFKLHTPSTLTGTDITITLIEHNGFAQADDNWDIQGIHVTGITAQNKATPLLEISNPRNSNNQNNCMARLKGAPNPSSVTYHLSASDPSGSNLSNPTFGRTPPGSCPQ